ncbi:BrnT family toxin [Paracoccus marinus]|uniref:BrnT family toxin n=1 Tax=Paracoccus marinus TaxID=288426 RepID=UPI0010E38F7E
MGTAMSEDDVRYEWNEAKRLATIEKHGIDFVRAPGFFAGPHVVVTARSEAEAREIAIGLLDDVAVVFVFTRRGSAIRVITARRARRNERVKLQDIYARRNPADDGPD